MKIFSLKWDSITMFKKYFSLILIIFLMFISLPISFAANNDILTDNNEYDWNSISENETMDISYDEIHVDNKGSDNNDGSYDNPLVSIEKAINVSSNNSKIIIHEGVYRENDLNITKSLEIIGEGNVVIDAESKSRIFTINTGTQDSVVLSGITFINGEAYQGGAIFVRNAVTVINNSRFINNTALTEGGAIYWNSDNGTLSNTIIENNVARDGSGVSWGGINSTFAGGDFGEIINCTFSNNRITQDEDACIALSVYSNNVKIKNSRFINHNTGFNSSFEVLYVNGDYSTVENCLFENNSMTLAGALGFDGNYANCYNNIFINNHLSSVGSFGGAIGLQSETANIDNNTFVNNGGNDCVGGAIFVSSFETFSFNFINITDNVFINNTAYLGGGVYVDGNNNMLSLLIKNNTFDGGNSIGGAGIYLINIYDPVTVESNIYKDLTANLGCGIHANSCILNLLNNTMVNCISLTGEGIYSNGYIYSNLKLRFNDVIGVLNQPTTLHAVLLDDMNNSISTNSINFKINGIDVVGTRGINSVESIFNSLGEYTISGDLNIGDSTVETGVLSILHGASLNVSDIIVWSKSASVCVNLTDDGGNPISNAYITIDLNGNDILLVTDSNGSALRNINFDKGIYNLTAKFDDNIYYKSINTTFTITVLDSINSSDMIRGYNSGLDFKAQFFNIDGSPLTNTKVLFNINAKNYFTTTDSYGMVYLNLNLSCGTYNVIVNNPSTNDTAYNSLQIVKRISNNENINTYFGAPVSYKLRIYGDDGNVVGAGEVVTINVASKTYKIKTDKTGHAVFKINLNPKSYIITATYKGFKVSNKITVRPVLTAKNISLKKSKKIRFKAKLLNANGKVVKGKKITFKIKGKTYKATTNKKGIATLTLKKLKAGKYTIISKYGKSTIKNTIKIKK